MITSNVILILLELVFLIIMAYGAVIDWKERVVYDKTWIAASIFSLLIAILRGYSIKQILFYSVWFPILLIIIEFINLLITNKMGVGGGDIKISPAVTLFYGPVSSYILMTVLILSLIGQGLFKQTDDEYIPLVSYLFIGCVISFIYFRI